MMFHKDILLSEENEETKLLEAEEADPGQKASSAQDGCLPAFALTSLGVLLLLLCVAYYNAAKGKNSADSFSSSKEQNNVKEQNTVIVNDQPDTFVYAMTYDPGFCYKKRESEWPGCFNSNKAWTKKLTIHGLWPEV
jgi:ribonuclease I